MKDAHPSVLLGQNRAVLLGELLVELITAISDRDGEVRPIRLLKSEDRGGVIAPKALQLQHPPSVSPTSPTRTRPPLPHVRAIERCVQTGRLRQRRRLSHNAQRGRARHSPKVPVGDARACKHSPFPGCAGGDREAHNSAGPIGGWVRGPSGVTPNDLSATQLTATLKPWSTTDLDSPAPNMALIIKCLAPTLRGVPAIVAVPS